MIVICDIDGTAANIDHRRHLVEKKGAPVDWDKFFSLMVYDIPNRWCQELLTALFAVGHEIFFVSGRPDKYRDQTRDWLHQYYDMIDYRGLFMRPQGNREQDYIVKGRIYDEQLKGAKRNILFAIDDRQQVVDMWREKGLTVLQCDEGNF